MTNAKSSREVVTREYEGLAVQFTGEGWFNATVVAERFGKEPVFWLRQRDTVEYVVALYRRHVSSNSDFLEELNKIRLLDGASAASQAKLLRLVKRTGLVKARAGAPDTGGGTWLHPKLAVKFARWLDVDFEIWCDEQIDRLIRGSLDVRRARHQASASFKLMTDMVKLKRDELGKETKSYHYSNEARLINWALTGQFTAVDRDELSGDQLDLLALLEERNTLMIAAGVEYQYRKITLQQLVAALPRANAALSAVMENIEAARSAV